MLRWNCKRDKSGTEYVYFPRPEDQHLTVLPRIYKQSKPATQSGEWKSHHWRMDWDILPKGHRWENPLMGWQSSADMMQGTRIFFETKEAAIHFAEKQGYEYYVQEPNTRSFTPKVYANNFLHSERKLKHIRTK
jgi:NADH dehydrogenase (ubiquinone) Fe-S protein 4